MTRFFRPEFLARLTEIVPFSPITEKIVVNIFQIQLKILESCVTDRPVFRFNSTLVQLKSHFLTTIVADFIRFSNFLQSFLGLGSRRVAIVRKSGEVDDDWLDSYYAEV